MEIVKIIHLHWRNHLNRGAGFTFAVLFPEAGTKTIVERFLTVGITRQPFALFTPAFAMAALFDAEVYAII